MGASTATEEVSENITSTLKQQPPVYLEGRLHDSLGEGRTVKDIILSTG